MYYACPICWKEISMQAAEQAVENMPVGHAILQGYSWREAVQAAGRQVSRATAYRQRQRLLAGGEAAWHDRRQGHASKVRGAVRTWLEAYYQHHPRASGKPVQALMEEQFGVRVSVIHLNRLRAALLGATRTGKNQPGTWQDGAGAFLLLAAAAESNLLPTLETTLPTQEDVSVPRRLAQATPRTRRQSLLTFLFLEVAEPRRPWDLQEYAQEGLALLTNRRRAYGYRTAERFLSQVARAGGAEAFTDALARWATQLWKPAAEETQPISPPYYVDGHRRPIFSCSPLPRA
jgi:transposase